MKVRLGLALGLPITISNGEGEYFLIEKLGKKFSMRKITESEYRILKHKTEDDIIPKNGVITNYQNKGVSMSIIVCFVNSKGVAMASDSREMYYGENASYIDDKKKIYEDSDFILGQMGANVYVNKKYETYDMNSELYNCLCNDFTIEKFFKLYYDGQTFLERFNDCKEELISDGHKKLADNLAINLFYFNKSGMIRIYNIKDESSVINNAIEGDTFYYNCSAKYKDFVDDYINNRIKNKSIEEMSVVELKCFAKEVIQETIKYANELEKETNEIAEIGGDIQLASLEFDK